MNLLRLKGYISSEKKLLSRCLNVLQNLPSGRLYCYQKGTHTYYNILKGPHLEYLGTQDNNKVNMLKKRYLIEQHIPVLRENLRLMQELSNGYKVFDPIRIQERFPKAYQGLDIHYLNDLGYQSLFYNKEGRKEKEDGFYEDSRKHKTTSGLYVRSRIEAMIANMYEEKGLVFEYEKPLYLSDGNMIRPDFTVYNPQTSELLYHEHIGLLSDKEYRRHFLWKLEQYLNNGYYPFHDVLFIFEKPDTGINLEEISMLIDLYMM